MKPLVVALVLACVPGRVHADGLCGDAVELLEGEPAPCDGVIMGPAHLGGLLQDRAHRRICEVELAAERKRSVIDKRGCDERVAVMAGAVDEANARAERFPWSHVLGALLVGLAAGAVVVGMASR